VHGVLSDCPVPRVWDKERTAARSGGRAGMGRVRLALFCSFNQEHAHVAGRRPDISRAGQATGVKLKVVRREGIYKSGSISSLPEGLLKRYPSHGSVRMYLGREGSSSIFLRRVRT